MLIRNRDHSNVRIHNSAEPINAKALDACEESLGVKLPSAYREFLLHHNGGKPSPTCFLLDHVVRPEIELFYSVAVTTPVTEVSKVCQGFRSSIQLPQHLIPIAKCKSDTILLLSCSASESGALYYCMEINETFHDGDDYTTVSPVYFSFDQLLDKLGPVRNRKDVDSLFFHLYYVSTNAQSGARTARKLVDSGYDINFVLPTFHHPIFGAIAAEAFKVARELVELGTRADHVDRKGVSVVDRLNEALAWWKNRLEEHKKGDSIYGMAKRRIDQIEETHAALPDASR